MLSMINTEGNNWSAIIEENISAPNTVYYYIKATANSGKTITRPLPAPDGYFKFKIIEQNNTSLFHNNINKIDVSIYPNPASNTVCVAVNCLKSCEGKIILTDILGKENCFSF